MSRVRLTEKDLDQEGLDLIDKGTAWLKCRHCETEFKVPRDEHHRLPNGWSDCPRCYRPLQHRVIVTWSHHQFDGGSKCEWWRDDNCELDSSERITRRRRKEERQ